jgi:hypothetical protein
MAPGRRRCEHPDAGPVSLPGACQPLGHLLVPDRRPLGPRGRTGDHARPTLQAFFAKRLIGQRASGDAIAGYRDTRLLLLSFAAQRTGKNPGQLDIADLDAPMIATFLDHLEQHRGNSPRTRNNQLAAIRSVFAWAALRYPEHGATIQRVLAITPKRFQRNLVVCGDSVMKVPNIHSVQCAASPWPSDGLLRGGCSLWRYSKPGMKGGRNIVTLVYGRHDPSHLVFHLDVERSALSDVHEFTLFHCGKTETDRRL